MRQSLPKTVDEAVSSVISHLDEESKNRLRCMAKDDLILNHISWRAYMEECGLWKKNKALLKNAEKKHPDDASLLIMEAVWENINKDRRVPKKPAMDEASFKQAEKLAEYLRNNPVTPERARKMNLLPEVDETKKDKPRLRLVPKIVPERDTIKVLLIADNGEWKELVMEYLMGIEIAADAPEITVESLKQSLPEILKENRYDVVIVNKPAAEAYCAGFILKLNGHNAGIIFILGHNARSFRSVIKENVGGEFLDSPVSLPALSFKICELVDRRGEKRTGLSSKERYDLIAMDRAPNDDRELEWEVARMDYITERVRWEAQGRPDDTLYLPKIYQLVGAEPLQIIAKGTEGKLDFLDQVFDLETFDWRQAADQAKAIETTGDESRKRKYWDIDVFRNFTDRPLSKEIKITKEEAIQLAINYLRNSEDYSKWKPYHVTDEYPGGKYYVSIDGHANANDDCWYVQCLPDMTEELILISTLVVAVSISSGEVKGCFSLNDEG